MDLPKVLSYPPRHPYIDRLHGVAATLVERDQPMPKIPNYYDVKWIEQNQQLWDIVHFHFGWEQYSVEHIKQVIAMHNSTGKPLVVTVHDTRNPHTIDSASDQKYLEILLSTASAVVTLTGSAQEYIRRVYKVDSIVIPHGPLLIGEEMKKYRSQEKKSRTIYVHVKSGRANLDYQCILAVSPDIEHVSGYKMVFGITRNSPAHDYVKTLSEECQSYVELQDELSHDELCYRLSAATAILLPYRWGSHSGLIELANDLGVPSLVYDTGHFKDQNPTCLLAYETDITKQRNVIIQAIKKLESQKTVLPSVPDRLNDLSQLIDGYRKIYERVRIL